MPASYDPLLESVLDFRLSSGYHSLSEVRVLFDFILNDFEQFVFEELSVCVCFADPEYNQYWCAAVHLLAKLGVCLSFQYYFGLYSFKSVFSAGLC